MWEGEATVVVLVEATEVIAVVEAEERTVEDSAVEDSAVEESTVEESTVEESAGPENWEAVQWKAVTLSVAREYQSQTKRADVQIEARMAAMNPLASAIVPASCSSYLLDLGEALLYRIL